MKTPKYTLILAVLLCFPLLAGCAPKDPEEIFTKAVTLTERQIAERGHLQETSAIHMANVRTYENQDGTQTMYMYSAPVSDALTLNERTSSYMCAGASIVKTIPKVWCGEEGMRIRASNTYATIFPDGGDSATAELRNTTNVFGEKKEAIAYPDAFGEGVDLLVYPTLFGLNLEIVLPQKPDSNTFRLKVRLPGLIPDTGSPDYILFRTALEDGNVQSLLYTPLAGDKKGRWSYNNQVRLTDKDPVTNTYTVEYTVDEEFLNGKDTRYPVTLNQSVHLYTAKQPDTSTYSETGDEAGHYLSPYMLLGDSTIKGEGWTYVRFETLDALQIDPSKVKSATYIVHNLFDSSREAFVSAYAVTADWCSINTRWFNRPTFDEKPLATAKVKKRGDVQLDVTALFKEMLRNKGRENAKYSVRNGFLIRCDTPGSNLLFASGDSGLYSPLLQIVLES